MNFSSVSSVSLVTLKFSMENEPIPIMSSVTEQVVTEQAVTEQAVTEQAVTEQAVTEQPFTEQTVSEQAVDNVCADTAASSETPASTSADGRKLFVGGISQEIGEKELRDYFGQFGDIEHVKVISDPMTGRSRGFAFLIFNSSEALIKVETAGNHLINGKKVDAKKAKARQSKIFVGGITAEMTDDEIKSHFAQFGTIVETQMPFDKVKNQRKGFCFIVFETEESVIQLLKKPKQIIKNKEVDVMRAASNPNQKGGFTVGAPMVGVRGGRGGRGGIRGGRGGRGGFVAAGFHQGFGAPGLPQGFGAPGFNYDYGQGFGQGYNHYGPRYQPY